MRKLSRWWAGEKRSRTFGLIQAVLGKRMSELGGKGDAQAGGGALMGKRTSLRAQGWEGENERAVKGTPLTRLL